ncbi:MAG: hypothetical protein AVDCRST_MAG86-3001 [uncultured Truepera sp.]|uniref:Polymerase nucleotidyl transferase domain-containing protein n=1 Tax=uncultured Truepera sp. TaxID=543023 RepID=A0A6J4VQK1_9DEIN|nr:MAG: hypothetical protein AVDCRST_MAG86-3001 [uncultured Truepera sp.]
MLSAAQLRGLSARFDAPQVQAVLLVGSYARGDAGPYSDVDILRLTPSPLPEVRSHLWQDKLVNVTDADPETSEAWFTEPEQAVEVVLGLRDARVLLDREGAAEALVARARAFVWTPELQEKADRWASTQLASWSEEAHKGLAGLQSGSVGKLLNAQFGLSWGLAKTVRVQRGLLFSNDNAFLTDLQSAFAGTRWLGLLHDVYGLTGLTLPQQVRAGLNLYALTAELLKEVLQARDRPVITHTVALIRLGR